MIMLVLEIKRLRLFPLWILRHLKHICDNVVDNHNSLYSQWPTKHSRDLEHIGSFFPLDLEAMLSNHAHDL
jgi:hypothetical protein